jgi:hypothetical protein
MSHDVRSQSPVVGGVSLSEKMKYLQSQLLTERRKLENMVIRQYEKGVFNLGSDIGILKQSSLMDKLLLEIMLLDQGKKR